MPTNSRVRNKTMNEIDARSNGGKLSYDIKESETKLKDINLCGASTNRDSNRKGFSLEMFETETKGDLNKTTNGFVSEKNLIGLSHNTGLSGLSLKSLASNHLNDLPGQRLGLGLSLGSLASENTASRNSNVGLASKTGTSGPSLSLLASNHLCSAPSTTGLGSCSGLSLGSLASTQIGDGNSVSSSLGGTSSSGLSLSSLASSHLGDGTSVPSSILSGSVQNTSQFKIPAIFGVKTSPPHNQKERSVSPELEIDLMTALKLESTGQDILKPEEEKMEEVKTVELAVPDLSRIESELSKRKRSEFSKVITRKWARLAQTPPVVISLPTNDIHVFQFTDPSPDDIVLKAQSQSKAFNRPSPVRQPVLS